MKITLSVKSAGPQLEAMGFQQWVTRPLYVHSIKRTRDDWTFEIEGYGRDADQIEALLTRSNAEAEGLQPYDSVPFVEGQTFAGALVLTHYPHILLQTDEVSLEQVL